MNFLLYYVIPSITYLIGFLVMLASLIKLGSSNFLRAKINKQGRTLLLVYVLSQVFIYAMWGVTYVMPSISDTLFIAEIFLDFTPPFIMLALALSIDGARRAK